MGWISVCIKAKWRLIVVLTITGLINQSIAQALPWFGSQRSDVDRPPNTGGQSAGSRGCSVEGLTPQRSFNTAPPLTILSPDAGLQYTTLEYPTFAWFMGVNTANPVEFRIYEYQEDSDVELFYSVELDDDASSPGIKLLSLPTSLPPLSLDHKYVWQVEVVCDPAHPSGNLFVEAELSRTALHTNQQEEITFSPSMTDNMESADQDDLWLDALHGFVQEGEMGDGVDSPQRIDSIEEGLEEEAIAQQNSLEQLAIATRYSELRELSQQFPIHRLF